jgi:hypothetical protein
MQETRTYNAFAAARVGVLTTTHSGQEEVPDKSINFEHRQQCSYNTSR